MPIQHIVQQGECLTSIAHQHGFRDWRAIYNHPDNAPLRRKRPNPNVLFPGDVVVLPDPMAKTAKCATGRHHRFQIKVARKELQLILRDHKGEPMKDAPVELDLDGQPLLPPEGQDSWMTDGNGLLKVPVPVRSKTAVLTVADYTVKLQLGGLNPLKDVPEGEVSGAQARLRNLGYDAGPVDGRMGPATRGALALFQADHGLEVTGKLDEASRKKLEELHLS